MTKAASPVLRKDAARNRALLLRKAEELFAETGLEVTLKDLAREAGVGVGTVYRHFPTKDDLVAALFAEQLRREAERARAMAEEPDAWTALVRYLEDAMRVQFADRGLRALMCPAGADAEHESVRECKAIIDPSIEQIVENAHRQGTLRPDCTVRDVVWLQVALVGIMDGSPAEPELYRRHLQVFLDGMRAR